MVKVILYFTVIQLRSAVHYDTIPVYNPEPAQLPFTAPS